MDPNRKTLQEINKWCSPYSILIIDKKGKIHRLFCPFVVESKIYLLKRDIGSRFRVDAVKLTDALIMVYVIESRNFPYHYFTIITQKNLLYPI